MASASFLDADPDDENNVLSIDTDGIFRTLTDLARSDIPAAAEAIKRILASFKFDQDSTTRRRQLEAETIANKHNTTNTSNKKTRDKRKSNDKADKPCEDEWKCEDCDKVFSSKSYLDRHINNEHSVKRRRLVYHNVFECDECDSAFATEAALRTHENTHASCSNAPNTTKYKCDLCYKERSGIYNHYKSVHKIEYPEQILFYSGNKLLHSAVDTKEGKAPWFIREKENVTTRYKDTTCRLCETEPEFDDEEFLEVHYTLMHMVDPKALNNINFLFRAVKGSHLGMIASQPVPRQKNVSTPIKEHVFSPRVKKTASGMRWFCNLCLGSYSNKANLKRHFMSIHQGKLVHNGASDSKSLIEKQENDKHTNKASDTGASKKEKCALCQKQIAKLGLYKHYGNVHVIEYPEEIMIHNGNVLVRSDIDTKGGQAPWFIKEKAKMSNFKLGTCRLCDTEYSNAAMLEKHYSSDHAVVPNALTDLQYLFRATKNAHLADLPTTLTPSRRKHRAQSLYQNNPHASDNKTEIKNKVNVSGTEHKNKKLIVRVENTDVNAMILYQCEECEVATTSYDASVEHAQLHYLEGYQPITETCHICKWSFEPQCFADHSTQCHDTERKILKYSPNNLLNDKWFTIFQGLPENFAEHIKSSSIYRHTRAVKINSDNVSGSQIPLYQCGICELFVHPQTLEEHCNNDNACIRNKSQDNYCPKCDIYFYSSEAITEHCKEHKSGLEISSFRKATFNCRQDRTINKALREASTKPRSPQATSQDDRVPNPVDNVPMETEQTSKPIEILENRLVSVFCEYCNKSIISSDFEAHVSTHNFYQDVSFEDNSDLIEGENCLNSDDMECENQRDGAPVNEAVVTIESNSNKSTDEQRNSDGDQGLDKSAYYLQVQVQIEEVDDVNQRNPEESAEIKHENYKYHEEIVDNTHNNNINARKRRVFDDMNIQVEINDVLSEDMANHLKQDLENLFNETESDNGQSSANADENLTTQDLRNILETPPDKETDKNQKINDNEDKLSSEGENTVISQDIFASDPNEQTDSNGDPEISMDIFEGQTITKLINTTVNNDENTKLAIGVIDLDTDDEDDSTESNSRPSSRDILSKMLSEDDSKIPGVLYEKKTSRQSFIDETKRIRELMFSRD